MGPFLPASAERPEFVSGLLGCFTLSVYRRLRARYVVVERIQVFRVIVDRYAGPSGPGRHDSPRVFRSVPRPNDETDEMLRGTKCLVHLGHRFLVITHLPRDLQANFTAGIKRDRPSARTKGRRRKGSGVVAVIVVHSFVQYV